MDEIQKVLIAQGRKDLAQKYFAKITKQVEKHITKKASMNKEAFTFTNGLASVSRTFSSLLVPMAEYVLTRYIKEDRPRIASSIAFDKKISLIDVQTDINKTAVAVQDMTAIYDDKIITSYNKYGDFVVTAYATDRAAAKKWQDEFEWRMINHNQYRGKCLYAEAGEIFFRETPDTKWDDVILNDKIKKDIRLNTVAFLGDKKLASAGVTKRGLVMFGPPGTGKTSVVKAIFKELQGKEVSRIYVTAESFRKMQVSNLFDMLRYLGSTVLAFEDIDFVGTSRDVHIGSNQLGDLLTNLDGMRKYKDPLVVMASTNKISMLDEALANRPCRFDRKIEIGLPSDDNLRLIYHRLISENVSDDIIRLSQQFTGSHVVEAVNTARILAANEDKKVAECLTDACTIIRDNFFPGQTTTELKASVGEVLLKGHIKGFTKAASKPKSSW